MINFSEQWIDFTGKTAVVTGGSRGIGAACCQLLASMGAKVIVNHSNSQDGKRAAKKCVEKISSQGGIASEYGADVSVLQEVADMFDWTEHNVGKVDVLICNAAITSPVDFEDLDYNTWKKTLDVNLTGVFHCLKHAIPHMLKAEKGSIVLVGSSVSYTGGGGGAHYCASKTGIEGLTRDLTKEYVSKNIRINTVLPSAVDTDLFRTRYPDPHDRECVARAMPIGRMGTAEEIANLIVFLASDKASFICGQHILIDGGRILF